MTALTGLHCQSLTRPGIQGRLPSQTKAMGAAKLYEPEVMCIPRPG